MADPKRPELCGCSNDFEGTRRIGWAGKGWEQEVRWRWNMTKYDEICWTFKFEPRKCQAPGQVLCLSLTGWLGEPHICTACRMTSHILDIPKHSQTLSRCRQKYDADGRLLKFYDAQSYADRIGYQIISYDMTMIYYDILWYTMIYYNILWYTIIMVMVLARKKRPEVAVCCEILWAFRLQMFPTTLVADDLGQSPQIQGLIDCFGPAPLVWARDTWKKECI